MEIKRQLQQFLTGGNTLAIAKVEHDLSFASIITMQGVAKFGMLKKEQELDVLKYTQQITIRFLQVNFPDINAVEVATQFALDVLESRSDWTLYDVIYFFKFIRQRQDLEELKIFGNAFKITPIILSRLVTVYEEHKSYAMDLVRNRIEFNIDKLSLPESVVKIKDAPRDNRFRELHKILQDKEDEKSNFVTKAAVSRRYHKENEFCLNWLKDQDATREEKIIWYNNFRIRKIK